MNTDFDMKYLAALDYDHLDNGVFLTTLARSLSQQQGNSKLRPILLHAGSEYTERIIQTGVMRDEATIRSIKDLNNRLIALMADEGVSAIGINPYKREVITHENGQLSLNHSFLNTLPEQSVLVLSTLIKDYENDGIKAIPLPRLAAFLFQELSADELFLFSKSDEAEIFTDQNAAKNMQWSTLDDAFRKKQLPEEFSHFNKTIRLATARDFNQLPNLEHTITISK